MKRTLKIIGIVFVAIIAALFLLNHNGFISPFPVPSAAMAPTYNSGDVLLVNKYDKQFSRGDVVVFRQQKYGDMLKRIVGLPSEKVEMRDGKVFINGTELREDYHRGETLPDLSVILANDQYFVLGDNRASSLDSRNFGPIAGSSILAKVSGVLYHASK